MTGIQLGDPRMARLTETSSPSPRFGTIDTATQYGSGFDGVKMRGSEHNDEFYKEGDKIRTKTNYSGGIQGGISNGEDVYFNVAFKPVATIMKEQKTLNEKGEEVKISGKGRHDPFVVPRAVPIVEAMAALVMTDFYLRNLSSRI